MEEPRVKIVLFGAGNVGTHIGMALSRVADVCQVVTCHRESAEALASMIGGGCCATADFNAIDPDADLYLIAAKDDAVRTIAEATPDFKGIWAHTSGSVPADVFRGLKSRYGVFYPLQTFTRDVPVDVSEVPFFIEGSDTPTAETLAYLAGMISRRVEFADSARRKILHVAAVFACNFANLMWSEADDILRAGGLDMTYLMPLLKVTLSKLEHTTPAAAMTGPARRGDRKVIAAHQEFLDGEKREIYALLSDAILKKYDTDSNE